MGRRIQNAEIVEIEVLENSLGAKIESVYFADALEIEPDVLEELLKSKNSEGTRRAYRRDITDFFVQMTNCTPNRDSILEFLHLEGNKATLIVTKYKARLNKSGLSANTINKRLAAIKSLVAYGRKLGVCNYAVDVDNAPAQAYRDTSGIEEKEFLLVIGRCDRSSLVGKRDFALLLLLWGNALRRNEISTLNVGHFDANGRVLWIEAKGKAERVKVNLPKKTVEALVDWLLKRKTMATSAPLFSSLDFKHKGHRLTGDGIYKIVRRLFKQAGVEKHMSPHRCRHSAITAILEKTDGNVRKAQKLSRHAKLETLQVYDDNRNRDQLEMSELLMDGILEEVKLGADFQ